MICVAYFYNTALVFSQQGHIRGKRLLAGTGDFAEALQFAILLNDQYFLV